MVRTPINTAEAAEATEATEATETTEATEATEATRTLTISDGDARDAINALRQGIADLELYELSADEEVAAYRRLAHDTATLARLSAAYRDYESAPLDDAEDDAEEDRAAIKLAVADSGMIDPESALSGHNLLLIANALLRGVKDLPAAPQSWDALTRESEEYFGKVARMAHALGVAAGQASWYIHRRISDREEAVASTPDRRGSDRTWFPERPTTTMEAPESA